jgi:hypothetical protein
VTASSTADISASFPIVNRRYSERLYDPSAAPGCRGSGGHQATITTLRK